MTATIVGPGGEVDVSDQTTRELGKVRIQGLDSTIPGNYLPVLVDSLGRLLINIAAGGGGGGDATEATLQLIYAELQQKLEAGQQVALDAATLAALESITATISGDVSLSAATLAALESITVTGPLTDTQLRASVVPVGDGGGSLTVDGPLTDTQLRATPILISGAITGTVTANLGTIDGAATEATLSSILTELGQKLEAGQSIALDAPTLAALESITSTVSGTVTANQGLATTLPNAWFGRDGEPIPLTYATTITASGDTTLITPTSGKKLRLRWVYAVDGRTDPLPIITFRFAANPIFYSAYAISKKQQFLGGTNESLIMNLDVAGTVATTVFYTEEDP